MPGDPRHLVRTRALDASEQIHMRHPLNPNSELFRLGLSDRVGMKRAHLSLVRIPPGKESFLPHSHAVQEEFLFILDGTGIAEIGGKRVAVGPGDYMGFPTDGTTHHLINNGAADLIYLMGGERTDVEVAHFPTLGKIGVQADRRMTFYDADGGQRLPLEAWIVKD